MEASPAAADVIVIFGGGQEKHVISIKAPRLQEGWGGRGDHTARRESGATPPDASAPATKGNRKRARRVMKSSRVPVQPSLGPSLGSL